MVNMEDYFRRLQQSAAKNDSTDDDEIENGHDLNNNNHHLKNHKPKDSGSPDEPSLPINPS